MKKMLKLRAHFWALVTGLLMLAAIAALPFAAQQPPPQTLQIPFDESRIVAELTTQLQLSSDQATTLSGLIGKRRARTEGLLRQMDQLPVDTPQFNELRGQLERERRAVLEEFFPALRPEQQTRLRSLIGTAPANLPNGMPGRGYLQVGNEQIELIEIQGHTDSTGSAAINRTLSKGRAESVRKYLAGKGVAKGRLTAKGFGPDVPLADNGTSEGREINRRVEFKVTFWE